MEQIKKCILSLDISDSYKRDLIEAIENEIKLAEIKAQLETIKNVSEVYKKLTK